VATGKAAEKVCPSLGLTPILRTVTDDRPELLHDALNDLLEQKIEAFFIPADPVLTRPGLLRVICDAAKQALIPVIAAVGDSMAYGPLMSYHCDFAEIGRQAGRQAAQLLNGVPLERVPPESPQIKKLTINLKVAQELGLSLPRQLVCQAQQFYQ
jgi:putative ABC transport system substrate-binding protein